MTRSEASSNLFRRYTMPDLLAEPDTFAWQVRGLLAQPTYGQIAGEMKVLKSLVLKFVMVGLASGLPIFGTFIPSCPQPVLAYVGEGGQAWWTRRIRRVCRRRRQPGRPRPAPVLRRGAHREPRVPRVPAP